MRELVWHWFSESLGSATETKPGSNQLYFELHLITAESAATTVHETQGKESVEVDAL
jgi:hypothetical protein